MEMEQGNPNTASRDECPRSATEPVRQHAVDEMFLVLVTYLRRYNPPSGRPQYTERLTWLDGVASD
jgi:hypothetical protein